MIVGVPRETVAGETRVASTPEIVGKLIAKGFDVVVEQGAGLAASFTDQDYEAAGAGQRRSRRTSWSRCASLRPPKSP